MNLFKEPSKKMLIIKLQNTAKLADEPTYEHM